MVRQLIFNQEENLESFENDSFIYTKTIFINRVLNHRTGVNHDDINFFKCSKDSPRSIPISRMEYELQKSKSNY